MFLLFCVNHRSRYRENFVKLLCNKTVTHSRLKSCADSTLIHGLRRSSSMSALSNCIKVETSMIGGEPVYSGFGHVMDSPTSKKPMLVELQLKQDTLSILMVQTSIFGVQKFPLCVLDIGNIVVGHFQKHGGAFAIAVRCSSKLCYPVFFYASEYSESRETWLLLLKTRGVEIAFVKINGNAIKRALSPVCEYRKKY